MDDERLYNEPEEAVEDEEQGMFEHFRLNVDPGQTPIRVDKFMAMHLEDTSRHRVQCAIKEGYVRVGDKVAKANLIVRPGDVIRFMMPYRRRGMEILPENIPLDIVYEDDDILIINKPKGMVVHPAPGHYDNTVVNAVMYHCKDNLSGINGVLRPGIVHRIDKDTTGSLVICKNDLSHEAVAKQLQEHTIKREYIAIVTGVINDDRGTIDMPVGRSKTNRLKMTVCPDGKRAVTNYEVIKRFNRFTLIRCRLETGRTHQIRVHMAHIGHPVAGDTLYGNGAKTPVDTMGQALHAQILGLIHPVTNEYIETNAPLPEYFKEFIETLEKV